MTHRKLLGATALQTGALILFASAAPAGAQTAPAAPATDKTSVAVPAAAASTAAAQPADAAAQPTAVQQAAAQPAPNSDVSIVITGSRIRRPNLQSAVPITTVTTEELTSRGEVSLGDALNKLPALRSTFSQANSTTSIGTAALSILDLRGLGTSRTLVLVNGRRVVTSQPGTFTVDVNTIPVDLIDRVDVVTGGNSAVYGSDAVAGVVNFILKRDYEGVKVRGQIGTSTYGDRDNKFASIVAGHNFMDGKINVTGAFEYSNSDPVFFSDRPYLGAYTGPSGFYTTEITNAPNRNFDNIPNVAFWDNQNGTVPGIMFGNISTGGYVLTACPAPTATNQTRVGLVCTGQTTPTGGRIAYNYAFMPDGTLVKDVPYFDNRAVGGGVFGGLSATGLENAMLLPGLKRYVGNIFLNGNFSDAFKPFVEGTFVKIDATQQSTQPTFVASTLSPVFSINNPFLSAQARQTLVNLLAPGATTFTMQRFNNDLGTRAENHERETYRAVVGARGTLSEKGNITYEVSLNYGHTHTYYETGGNVLVANFNKAANAVRDANGNIVCAVNADANPANDDPNCAPIDLFGYGNESQAAKDYVLYTSSRVQNASELDGVAFISGDSSGFFRLPGGPIGFSLGGEYRTETASSVYDPVTTSGATFLNAFQPFLPPKEKIAEGFGELRVPILADMKFIKELTLEGAARYSHYNTTTGGVWAYNAGLTYSPFSGIRFRGDYARSVRAPTLSDLYAAATQTFANNLTDPCDQPGGTNQSNNITSNPNRAKNCAAAGIPTTITYVDNSGNTITQPWTNVPQSGVLGINSGNPNLKAERGDSLTIGTVITPKITPGFAVTIDYWRIKVKNVISGLSGQQIINRCYDDPTGINNEFCAAIARQVSTNPLINGTFAGQSTRTLPNLNTVNFPTTGNAFINQPYNFAALVRRGIDFDASYTHRLPGEVRMSLHGIMTLLLESQNFSYLTQPDRSDKIDETFGDPRWRASWNANFDWRKWGFSYSGTYVGKQTILSWETQFTHQGRGPTNPEARPIAWYPSQITHNVRVNFDPISTLRLYAGVDNIGNERPPYDLNGTEAGSPYDPTGRYFYAGAQLRFK
jgi:outer membrane receptor protein involved in Fe transport